MQHPISCDTSQPSILLCMQHTIWCNKALAATVSNKGKNNRSKLGHWARECRSQKKDGKDKVKAATPNTDNFKVKPKTKPLGSANAVTVDDTFDGNGF